MSFGTWIIVIVILICAYKIAKMFLQRPPANATYMPPQPPVYSAGQ